MEFKEIQASTLKDNFFKAIGKDWMLITAGTKDSFNTMTASWGTIGVLWNKTVAICFVRPQRHTFKFMEDNEFFTLTFFDRGDRNILQYCGTHSGRNVDKMAETGLKPRFTDSGNVYFEQARLVMECKKLYSDHIKPDMFHIPGIRDKTYPSRDYHKFYIGEITSCMQRSEE